ncbi:MAG: 16S rRNA (guanine(527)-N(7))-methyltransferase RsmG [Acidimicrobiia bacterium]
MDAFDKARSVATWAGHSLDERGLSLLAAYATWLEKEALPAGGIGPDEAPRIWDRHICDSLSFARAWPSSAPATAIDVGSGVGLPGVALAILWPDTRIVLLDRSGRRVALLRRLVRVLQLDNVEPVQGDIAGIRGSFEGILARGVMNPDRLAVAVRHLCSAGGRAVVGLSRGIEATASPPDTGRVITIPPEVLDGGGRILIIEPCDE